MLKYSMLKLFLCSIFFACIPFYTYHVQWHCNVHASLVGSHDHILLLAQVRMFLTVRYAQPYTYFNVQ